MNVLLIDHAPFFGGAESFLIDLVSALDQSTFSPIVVTDSTSPVIDRFDILGVPIRLAPLPPINRHPLFFLRLLRSGTQLARIVREANADVLHSFTVRTHLIGAVASQLSGAPLLWRLCDDTLPSWTARLFGRVPRRIVAVSRYIARTYPMLHIDGLAPDGARPASTVTRESARTDLGLRDDALVAIIVGRLVRWKGQDVFIRALAQVASSIPNVRGLIVGTWSPDDPIHGPLGGGETYANELHSLARELGIADRVTFAGFMRDPGKAYIAADVVVHASTSPEAFGRSIIEGMMAARPVIAADAGAPPEIITPDTGLLTCPGDADALATALTRLFGDTELRNRMGQAARVHAQTHYSLETMTRTMEHWYTLTAK